MLYNLIRRLGDFISPPTAVEVAKRELEDARRELLEWERAKEDAEAMTKALHARIDRLHAYTTATIRLRDDASIEAVVDFLSNGGLNDSH